MDRIATKNTYDVALLGIYTAQNREAAAAAQISSLHVASDLKGYAGQSDALIATQTVKARLDTYAASGVQLSDKLSSQDVALSGYGTAVNGAGQAVLTAIATGDGSTLSASLQSALQGAADALNANYQGSYLFAGGSQQAPVAVTTLAGLAAAPATLTGVFKDAANLTSSRLDDNIKIATGVSATTTGSALFTALKPLADYLSTSSPPNTFSKPLTTPEKALLQTALTALNTAGTQATAAVASNGLNQKLVSNTIAQLNDQQAAANATISNITSANIAQADSDLSLAQVALQASSQVFATLKSSSLLNFLSTTGG